MDNNLMGHETSDAKEKKSVDESASKKEENATAFLEEIESTVDEVNMELFEFGTKDINDALKDPWRKLMENEMDRLRAKNSLEMFALNIKTSAEKYWINKTPESDRETILEKAEETLKWLKQNELAKKDEFEIKDKELQLMFMPIIIHLYHTSSPIPGFLPSINPGTAFGDYE